MDKDNSGLLDLGQLSNALTDLGLPLNTPAQSQAMAMAMASGKKGLDVKEFKALVKTLKGLDGKLKATFQMVAATTEAKVKSSKGTGETVGQVFRRFDKDGGGTLDARELRAALFDLAMPLDTPTAKAALSKIESSGTGLTQKEFKTLVKELKAAPAATSPGLKRSATMPSMPGTGETVGQVFRRMDVDGGGTLDVKELQAALIDLGLPLDTPAHANAVAEFQASGATGVDVKQFKALIKAIKEQVAAGYGAARHAQIRLFSRRVGRNG